MCFQTHATTALITTKKTDDDYVIPYCVLGSIQEGYGPKNRTVTTIRKLLCFAYYSMCAN